MDGWMDGHPTRLPRNYYIASYCCHWAGWIDTMRQPGTLVARSIVRATTTTATTIFGPAEATPHRQSEGISAASARSLGRRFAARSCLRAGSVHGVSTQAKCRLPGTCRESAHVSGNSPAEPARGRYVAS